MEGLLKGIAHGASDVKAFFYNLATDITGPLKSVWGGLVRAGGAIGGFFAKLLGFHGGGGVGQWSGVVAQALSMLGLPMSLGPLVLYQMQTESGGNVNAINLTDINAQMGDPSRGLMQVIGSTFAAYHVPGTSTNIYDPLANVAAALNYAMHNRGFGTGPGQIGSGHGYDTGGWLPPGVSLAYNMTGQHELVTPQSELRKYAQLQIEAMSSRRGGGNTYEAHFDGLTGAAIESHVRTAFQAITLTQGHLDRQGRRN
jgi:SLT domain-containing protein